MGLGGTLRVRHRGQTVDFAWGGSNPQDIQWAAFYGDCEHEVLEVTKGHRVTLTYNLYYSSIGRLAQPVSTTHHLPLYHVVREMLQESAFMKNGNNVGVSYECSSLTTIVGGTLGFFCHHQYAHSQESGRKSIPMAFKGVDLAIYSVFQALGLTVGIHPIVKNKSKSMGGLSIQDLMGSPSQPDGDYVENCLKAMALKEGDHTFYDCEYMSDEDEDGSGDKEERRTIVGTKLHGPTFDENYDMESEDVSVPLRLRS